MIGTALVEDLVRSVAVSHLLKGHRRVSLLLLAAPESGKTSVANSALAPHITRVAVMSGRSIVREIKQHPETEFLLFNDLTSIRAMATPAVNLLINILNQCTQGEFGKVAFAGKEEDSIDREIGIIGCLPFETFRDHRSRWRELGFISRMVPFAYQYPDELVMEIKDLVDIGSDAIPAPKRPKMKPLPLKKSGVMVQMTPPLIRQVRRIADVRSHHLGQIGIRLLKNYHSLVRAHALLHGRRTVISDDVDFLRDVDSYVSIRECKALERRANERQQRQTARVRVAEGSRSS